MPRLARIRFVNVGPRKARMEDLEIDLRDASGVPTDTAIWLDNGFGKSTMVNLFFAMVRPATRDFVGRQVDNKKLEDYILAKDHSVVAAEWVLDAKPGDPELFGSDARLVTGTFMERTRGGDEKLDRHFFAFYVVPGEPCFTLEGLPLYTDDTRTERWTLAGFKARMGEAAKRAPQAELIDETVQKKWLAQLDDLGLDPDLFDYQTQMNAREAGAADLFKFKDVDQFLEFFLNMVQDPELGEGVSAAIGTYRSELRQRKDRLLPERDLVEGLVTRFKKLREIHGERSALQDRMEQAADEMGALRTFLDTRITSLQADVLEWTRQATEIRRVQSEQARRADQRTRFYAAVRLHFAELRLLEATNARKKLEDDEKQARRMSGLWRAAFPLAAALQHERLAQQRLDELREARAEHAPLEARLREAARRYAAAILAAIAEHGVEQAKRRERASEHGRLAEAERRTATKHLRESTKSAGEALSIRTRLRAAEADRERLVKIGAIAAEEAPAAGHRRWILKAGELRKEKGEAEAQREHLKAEVAEQNERVDAADGEAREASQAAKGLADEFSRGSTARADLEADERLLECLEVERLDLDTMPDASLLRIKREIERLQASVYRLFSDRADTERLLDHLERTQLLPPSREVAALIERLQGEVEMALSGWEYAAQSLSIASGEARAFVERAPHLALGVIVRDKDVDKARSILDACDLELDVPVVVAPESAVRVEDSSAGFVFGPSNDAHFDRNAGSELFQRRTASLRTVREQIEREESWLEALRTLDFRLAEFRATYPRGWFAAQAEKVRTAEEWADDRAEHHRQAVARRNGLVSELDQVGQRIQGLDTEISGVERQGERIEGHIAQFGVDLEPERQRAAELEAKAAQEEAFADEATNRAEQHAADAAALNEEIVAAEGAIGGLRERQSQIKYRGNDPLEPQPGNLAEYEAQYSQRLAHYRKEIGEDAMQALAEQQLALARNQRAQFRKLLPSPSDEAEVIALVGTMSPEEAEAQREAALNSPLMGAVGAIGNAVQRETRAQGDAKEARDFARGLTDLPEIVPGENGAPADADEAAAWLPLEKKVIDEMREQVEAANGEALQVEAEVMLAEQQAKTLRKDIDRLRTLRQSNEILIAGYAARPPAVWRPPENDAAIDARLNQLEEGLYAVGQEQQKLNARLDGAIATINQWTESDQFAKIAPDSAMVRDIRARSPRETEDDAERILQELDLRLAHINRTIAEVDRHRATLVEQMLSAAERGVQLLKAAETQSQLPAHMPRFGKMNFLKVRLGDTSAADRRTRMEILLDEVINRESIPSGPKLVQDAVKRLGHPIEVLMLFPDPLRDAEYKPVQHMGINSGGEQLTMAVLLYCTLAQLRARNLGRHRVTTSTLLLDNPFGAASRASFIELQMEVARAARIQLVYTTGIKDWDAVAMFPNVNRIRPGGVDLNTGEFLLERDSVGTGMAVAQLYRNPTAGRTARESQPA